MIEAWKNEEGYITFYYMGDLYSLCSKQVKEFESYMSIVITIEGE